MNINVNPEIVKDLAFREIECEVGSCGTIEVFDESDVENLLGSITFNRVPLRDMNVLFNAFKCVVPQITEDVVDCACGMMDRYL